MKRYNPKDIEPKWQNIWEETGTYTADLQSNKPKYIAMSMFNYPSGAGIHIGHAMNYTISDVKARFKRQQGFESYHPVGWDAFGLPAENYAIKAGVSPQESMATIIPSYHKQYKAMGWSNDWEKEIATHLPEYYKWTQWIFSEMYRHNLAYQDARMQWWCTKCQTVLANEQVIDGKCWRHDAADDPVVEKKEVKQWFFKITAYADELLEAIDGLDWTETVKLAQKNWIGRKTGINITYGIPNAQTKLAVSYVMGVDKIDAELEAVGATIVRVTKDGHYCVTVPVEKLEAFEKLIVEKLKPGFWNEYISDEAVFNFKYDDGTVERIVLDEANEPQIRKLGLEFNNQEDDGTKVWQWLNQNEFYRDYQPRAVTCFTTRPDTNFGATFVVISPEHALAEAVASGDIVADDGVDRTEEAARYIKAAGAKSDVERQQEGRKKTGVFTGLYAVNNLNGRRMPIWIADFVLAGFGTGAVVGVPGHDIRDFEFAMAFDLPVERVVVGEDGDESPITTAEQVQEENGTMINSGFLNGMNIHDATENIMSYMESNGMGKRVVNYRMRDWSVSRQRYWGAPIPIIYCEKCGPVPVPDKDLPVVLPELDDFKPSGDGRSALARAKDWLSVDCPECGGPAERETDTLDTYICSSWYMYRYFDPRNQQEIFDSNIVKKWEPIDFYNGADHATAHLLYARFIGHFFKDLGLVNEPEPFKSFLFNGKVTAQDGQMFSKSKGNGVDPLDIIDQGYGADALRMYLMFASPLDLWTRWDPQGVPGAYRFLNRLWNLVAEYAEAESAAIPEAQQLAMRRTVHQMIKKITEDIEANRYNTAIAAAMGSLNDIYKHKTEVFGKSDVWQEALQAIVACVAPFAPHIAEELWHQLGHSTTVHIDSWPKYDEKYLADDKVTIAVQINGKVRAQIQVTTDADEAAVTTAAQAEPKVQAHADGKQIIKTIYVPGKILNIVVR